MLYTNLKHIETEEEFRNAISKHENLMVICGRMEPESIRLFSVAEELSANCNNIEFFDMEPDNPETKVLFDLSQIEDFSDVPFIVLFRRGNIVKVTKGQQSKEEMKEIVKIVETE